jgi:hypothetical protein
VEPAAFIDRTPGTVAILRSRVEEAGGDPDAVARWVKAHGGRVDRTLAYRRRQAYGPRFREQESPGKDFYVVPTEALGR